MTVIFYTIRILIFYIPITILFLNNNILSQDKDKSSSPEPVDINNIKTSSSIIKFYQNVMAPTKLQTCRMHPSCSEYGLQAFQAYPFWEAIAITSDRLHRCGRDLHYYNRIYKDSRIKYNDQIPSIKRFEVGYENNVDSFVPSNMIGLSIQRQNEYHQSDSLLFDFARYLYDNGTYLESFIEFQRLVRYYPNSKLLYLSHIGSFQSLYAQAEYREAINYGMKLIENKNINNEYNPYLYFWMGAGALHLGNYRNARETFKMVTEIYDKSYYDKSLILTGVSFAYEQEWYNAEKVFASFNYDSPYYDNVSSMHSISLMAINHNWKNPTIAGLLGIVPGAGYLYSGFTQTAISAFIINSLFMGATYKAFEDGNIPLGVILSFISAGWYSGSIYGSIAAAYRRNETDQNNYLLKLNVGFRY